MADDFELAWKNVLFNQFHDILAGMSIEAAYDQARLLYDEARAIADRAYNTAVQSLAWQIHVEPESETTTTDTTTTVNAPSSPAAEPLRPEDLPTGMSLNQVGDDFRLQADRLAGRHPLPVESRRDADAPADDAAGIVKKALNAGKESFHENKSTACQRNIGR